MTSAAANLDNGIISTTPSFGACASTAPLRPKPSLARRSMYIGKKYSLLGVDVNCSVLVGVVGLPQIPERRAGNNLSC